MFGYRSTPETEAAATAPDMSSATVWMVIPLRNTAEPSSNDRNLESSYALSSVMVRPAVGAGAVAALILVRTVILKSCAPALAATAATRMDPVDGADASGMTEGVKLATETLVQHCVKSISHLVLLR